MHPFQDSVKAFSRQYKVLKNNPEMAKEKAIAGTTYFIKDHNILTLPQDEGESRYPYGKNGFNFWAYASGYMHCNEGLFSPFLRATEGQEPKIALFAGFPEEEGYVPISLLSVPVMEERGRKKEQYTIFTPNSVFYITETDCLRFTIRVFVDHENRMYFSLLGENLEKEPKKIYLSSYLNPFLKHAIMENSVDRWFREVKVLPSDDLTKELNAFLIQVYEEADRSSMTTNYGLIRRKMSMGKSSKVISTEETTSRFQYVGGVRSSLHTPKALYKGTFGKPIHICTFTETGIAGDLIHCEIAGGDFVRVDILMDYCFDEETKNNLLQTVINSNLIDSILCEMESEEKQKQRGLCAVFGESKEDKWKGDVFTAFFEHLKKQVEFCSTIKGYIQLSTFSLIGIRDIFQALEGLLFWQPEVVKDKMLEALNFVSPDGRCPRQYSLPDYEGQSPAMDLRPFIDQGAWVISTIITYLRVTRDFSFLNEICGYYDFIDDKNHKAVKSNKCSTVLQHMFDIMEYLLRNRDHDYTKCVLALYGDWNDALDGLGVSQDGTREYGTGVSVMATLQVYQNLEDMMELLRVLDVEKYKEVIERYKSVRKEIEQGLKQYALIKNEAGDIRILHGWGDQRSYFVGSFRDTDYQSRDGLTSNAFWVLSKLYDTDTTIKDTILQAFSRLDSKYGLKTFEPYFPKNTPGVGRIPNLPAGTAENGAVYIHATLFGIMALFRMGYPELAWAQLYKILPFTHEKVSCSPFVMPNSYGYNEEKNIDGESMLDWQTGSSNVLLKTLIRCVFGLEPHFDGMWIQPSQWMPFKSFDFVITVRNCRLNIKYSDENKGSRGFKVNGQSKEGVFDRIMQMNKLWISNEELKQKELVIHITD